MADEYIPTLTLDPNSPLADPAPAAPSVPQVQEAPLPPSDLEESRLSEAERKAVEEFAQKIDVTDANMILQYGSAAQKNVSEFSENALQQIRTKDLGQIGDTLTGLVKEI